MSSKELALEKARELSNGKKLNQIAPAASSQTREQHFLALVKVWKDERGPYSSSARLCAHPAYQQIIGMGPDVVPLLL
ncbi:MAG TPA: hypothetical protein VE988_18545, partial [Gemmataceae bacterium]|nr:hypothetical protein [Gemmataceae bacterium]